METLHDPLKKQVAESLLEHIEVEMELSTIYHQLVEAPNFEMGHLAFPCFILSKTLKQNPAQLAQAIAAKIKNPAFVKVMAQGPYVNFFFTNSFLAASHIAPILSGDYFKRKLTQDMPKTMIEYSQPNTHKEIHVGHMRNLCLGLSLINLHRYLSIDTVSATFPGDVGTHVAKCLWYLKFHNTEATPKERKGAWLGRMYSLAHNKLEDEKGTPKEDQNRQELTVILKQLESKNGEYYQLWKETRQWSIDQLQEVYQWADVQFDKWYWESEVDSDSLNYAKKLFKESQLIQSEGAIGMDLSSDNLGFCMLIKTDGTGLYATKDIELARRKFEENKIEKNIYVVDKRQAHHFAQVFKVLDKIGFEHAKNCYHLQYDFVELPSGAMSSRKGNIVPIGELIANMEKLIKSEFLHRYENDWPVEDINQVAQIVAQGAIKYGMTRIDNGKKIVFDMQEWLRLDGESGPYIQYTHARISSLLKKQNYNSTDQVQWDLLQTKNEIELLFRLGQLNNVAIVSCLQYKTNFLCNYLYHLAKLFNSYYAETSISQTSEPLLKQTRLALLASCSMVIKKGLNLLGIPAPEKM